ncbi:unnamed protein product [Sphagnum troendelagicum]|uniref:Uncharacterized protein n=1 Tax=Sphagnum troendelagicum TaxID=128251 RepID=A0ABP0V0X8_9BRYO
MHFTLICRRLLGAISICTTQGPQYVCCTNFSILCLNNTMQWLEEFMHRLKSLIQGPISQSAAKNCNFQAYVAMKYMRQNLMGVGFIGLVMCISIHPLSMPLYQIPWKIKEDIHIPTKLAEAQNVFHVIAQVTRRHNGDIDSCDSLRSVLIWLKLLAWQKRKGP